MAKVEIDVAALLGALDQARMARGLTWRRVAADCGVSPSLFSRLKAGNKPDADGFMALVTWLGLPAERLLVGSRTLAGPAWAANLALLLRESEDLDEDDVELLLALIQATVRRAAARRAEVTGR